MAAAKVINIGGKAVGGTNPCYIVGEVGINHNGDIAVAMKLADYCDVFGFDCVKLQKRDPDVCVPSHQRELRRTTPWGGFIGLLIGTLSSLFLWAGEQFLHLFSFGSSEGSSMWRALIAFLICFVVTIVVSLLTKPKPDAELKGLVYSLTPKAEVVETVWYKRPLLLAGAALVILIILNIIFF